MTSLDYCVTLDDDGWRVRLGGRSVVRYDHLQPALDASVGAAQRVSGVEVVRVLVEDDEGELQVEWTSTAGFCRPMRDD